MPATKCEPDAMQVAAWQRDAAAESGPCFRTDRTLAQEALPSGGTSDLTACSELLGSVKLASM